MAGFFRDVLTLGGLTLTSAGEEDVFVAKWQIASRTFVWAERVGGPYSDAATALAVRDSILYVAGSFNGGNGRGGGTVAFGNNVLTSPGNSDCFVARLTDNGSHARFGWAMQAGGVLNDAVRAIAVRDSSVYVAGYYQNPGATFGTTVLPSVGAVGSSEGFLARVADAGATASLAWTYRLGGAGEDDAYAVAVQGQAVYVAGYFEGTADLGTGPTQTQLSSAGARDAFVARFADAGASANVAWASRLGASFDEEINALAVSGDSLYVAGLFYGATTAIGPVTLTNAGSQYISDTFVAKLTTMGTSPAVAWALRCGGGGGDQATALAVRGPALYVAGKFLGSAFDVGPFTLTNPGTFGDYQIYVAAVASRGSNATFTNAWVAGAPATTRPRPCLLLGTSLYVAGYAMPPADFGSFRILNATPNQVGFLAVSTVAVPTAAYGSAARVAWAVYPNPAHGRATVQLPGIPGTHTATLTVLDALGRAIRTQTAATNARSELDLTGLPAGLYAVRVQAGGSSATRRLVVE